MPSLAAEEDHPHNGKGKQRPFRRGHLLLFVQKAEKKQHKQDKEGGVDHILGNQEQIVLDPGMEQVEKQDTEGDPLPAAQPDKGADAEGKRHQQEQGLEQTVEENTVVPTDETVQFHEQTDQGGMDQRMMVAHRGSAQQLTDLGLDVPHKNTRVGDNEIGDVFDQQGQEGDGNRAPV